MIHFLNKEIKNIKSHSKSSILSKNGVLYKCPKYSENYNMNIIKTGGKYVS